MNTHRNLAVAAPGSGYVAVLTILGITGITLHLIVRRTQRSLLHWVDRGQH